MKKDRIEIGVKNAFSRPGVHGCACVRGAGELGVLPSFPGKSIASSEELPGLPGSSMPPVEDGR